MIHQVDSDVLDLEHKQMLVKVLANLSAGYADRAEQETQNALRRQIDEAPNPTSQSVIDRAGQDRTTPYVAGQRNRRTVLVTPQPSASTLASPVAVEIATPVVLTTPAEQPQSFLARLLAWFRAFPTSSE